MKEYLKRGITSFAISSFAGLLVNLTIDLIANLTGHTGFVSMSSDYISLFPSIVLAAYVNILLYGVIGATFAMATVVYEIERMGFVIQSIIYFVITSSVCMAITIFLWQLYKYPAAIICTLLGFAVSHVLMITNEYRRIKADIKVINEISAGRE
ncbi:MAG: DUF3021 domain-containing protein [Clostridiales bacterium]|nr:DUF3021 domain-containing protein [Clostridiales bacterium]